MDRSKNREKLIALVDLSKETSFSPLLILKSYETCIWWICFRNVERKTVTAQSLTSLSPHSTRPLALSGQCAPMMRRALMKNKGNIHHLGYVSIGSSTTEIVVILQLNWIKYVTPTFRMAIGPSYYWVQKQFYFFEKIKQIHLIECLERRIL